MEEFINYWVEKSVPFLKVRDEVAGTVVKERLIVLKHPRGFLKLLHVNYDNSFIKSLVNSNEVDLLGNFVASGDMSLKAIDDLCLNIKDVSSYKLMKIQFPKVNEKKYISFRYGLVGKLEGLLFGDLLISKIVYSYAGISELYVRDRSDTLIPICIQISSGVFANFWIKKLENTYHINYDLMDIVTYLETEFKFKYLGVI